MTIRRTMLLLLILGMSSILSLPAYGAQSGDLKGAAQKEGKLIIYSSTDSASVEPLLQDFKSVYPFLQVEYNDLNTTELYNRFLAESASGAGTADLMWSSAMDLQLQLASKGNALTYASPENSALPKWAVWQNQAYGTTFEPVSIAYNKRLLPADAVPQSHADLIRLMKEKPDVFKEKIATFDPEKSGVGFLMMTQDAKVFPQFGISPRDSEQPAPRSTRARARCSRRSAPVSTPWLITSSARTCCCGRRRTHPSV